MLDHILAREAFRARLLTLVIATTGSTSLSTTTTGYARAAGSFLDDGFAPGMEVVGAGFPGSIGDPAVIETVDALSMKITGGKAATVAAGSRSLTVGLPVEKQWESTQTPYADRPGVRPYIAEQWVTGSNDSMNMNSGPIVDTGIYALTWYALANKGVLSLFRETRAVRLLFPPGLHLVAGDATIRVLGSPAPTAGQAIPLQNGYVTSVIRIPWRAVSANVTAA